MAELLYRIGRACARHARITLAAWIVVLIGAGIGFTAGFGTLSDNITIPGTPTAQVSDRLQHELPDASGGSGMVVLTTTDGKPFTQDQKDGVADLIEKTTKIDGVAGAVDPFKTEAERADQAKQLEAGEAAMEAGQLPEDQAAQVVFGKQMMELTDGVHQVSSDGSTAIVPVSFTDTAYEIPQETKDALMAAWNDHPVAGVDAEFDATIATGTPELLGAGEVLGVVIAAVVLIIMLGSLVAAGLPILAALFGVAVSALATLAFSSIFDMVSVTPILGIMLGLAVGIDYSLFIINRHRQQLRQGIELEESIGLANGTSGSAVLFAGITVIIALLALNITGIGFLGMMGTVAAIAIAIAVAVALTFTPALLKFIGARALSRKERRHLSDGPARAGDHRAPRTMSTASAALRAIGGIAVLVLVALPATSLRLNLPDGGSEPHDSTQYQAYTTIADKFGPGMNGPLLAVVDLPEAANEQQLPAQQLKYGKELLAQPDVAAIAPIGNAKDGSMIAFQVVPAEGPTSESTEDLVHHLRDTELTGGAQLSVAGQASGNIDVSQKLADALPLYLIVVVGLSLLILIGVFRSLLVPIIATAGFVLSFFAALGGVVAIYQWGWLGSVFGVQTPGPVLSFLPTIMVGILFGLAMDYTLFLVSGMREAYAHGAAPRQAVARGFKAGRSVVTAAAIIMISVFAGFIFADMSMIRPIGFALAFGVLADAFIVRMLIMPALLHLLGKSAWWLPKWLDKIVLNLDVEGTSLTKKHAAAADDGGASAAKDEVTVS